MKTDTKPVKFHMNRSFRFTQPSFLHRSWEMGTQPSSIFCIGKIKLFLFVPGIKGDIQEEGKGKEINPKDKTRTFRVLLTIFIY